MHDVDVRTALREYLDVKHAGDSATKVVEELSLCESARVDFAVINGSFTGFELKSERDTLARLPNQAATYNRVFDYVHLVSAKNHVARACEVIPPWWGILVAEPISGDVLALSIHRSAQENPSVDPAAIVQLLRRDEALSILARRGADRGVRSKPREAVWARLLETVSLTDLREEVRTALRVRPGWQENAERRGNALTSRLSGTTPRFLARRIR